MQKTSDIMTINFGDFHSGGLTALFPDYSMQFVYDEKNVITYSPSPQQVKMYEHFLSCARLMKLKGKGKRKIYVMNGDAIDGNHHNTVQIISANPKHQAEIHIELMETFLHESGFSIKNGDELHYVSGTESHTGWTEYEIAQTFSQAYNAQYHDELRLVLNGRRFWWTHQGARAGKGANEGNPLRNFGRDLYFDCVKYGNPPPHMITMSHFHKASYDSFNDSYRHTMHINLLPSWQHKTRFGIRASAFQRNDIGMLYNIVTGDGAIQIYDPLLME